MEKYTGIVWNITDKTVTSRWRGHYIHNGRRARTPIANESEMRQISNYALIFSSDYPMRRILDASADTDCGHTLLRHQLIDNYYLLPISRATFTPTRANEAQSGQERACVD